MGEERSGAAKLFDIVKAYWPMLVPLGGLLFGERLHIP